MAIRPEMESERPRGLGTDLSSFSRLDGDKGVRSGQKGDVSGVLIESS